MVPVELFILAITTTTAVCLTDGEKECPPWFEWVNSSDSSGYCACSERLSWGIKCDQRKQMSFVWPGNCVFYDNNKDAMFAGRCPFVFSDSVLKTGFFPLPANVSELNSVVCGYLSREVKGPLCGRCTNNTGPSIYSIGIQCVPCSPVNILYYLLLQYLPSTLIFLIVIVFRPTITSAPMVNYVLFCNCIVFYSRIGTLMSLPLDNNSRYFTKLTITLSAIWSFDAMFFLSPPLCVSEYMEEVYLPLLQFVAFIYPFLLLLLTYGLIKAHTKNYKVFIFMWKKISRLYVVCYRAWDPRSSMIQAFASLFFLSYARLNYLVLGTFIWSKYTNDKSSTRRILLYSDPNTAYLSIKHVIMMIFSVAMAVFFFLPPLLILVVYPTSLYRKISHWISPKWKLRIKTYVEIFQGSFKDGTDGMRDYRCLSGWFILFMGVFPLLLFGVVTELSYSIDIALCTVATFYIILSFACIQL